MHIGIAAHQWQLVGQIALLEMEKLKFVESIEHGTAELRTQSGAVEAKQAAVRVLIHITCCMNECQVRKLEIDNQSLARRLETLQAAHNAILRKVR